MTIAHRTSGPSVGPGSGKRGRRARLYADTLPSVPAEDADWETRADAEIDLRSERSGPPSAEEDPVVAVARLAALSAWIERNDVSLWTLKSQRIEVAGAEVQFQHEHVLQSSALRRSGVEDGGSVLLPLPKVISGDHLTVELTSLQGRRQLHAVPIESLSLDPPIDSADDVMVRR